MTIDRIGLEFEMLAVHKNGDAAKRNDMLALWEAMSAIGWEKKNDPYNGELLGVKKQSPVGTVVVDNDGGPPLLEVALPPHVTIADARKHLFFVLQDIYASLPADMRLLGYGIAPFTDLNTVTVTPKSYYPDYIACMKNDSLRPFYAVGALQVSLSAAPDLLPRALHAFLQLTGPLLALSANTEILEGKKTEYKDMRGAFLENVACNITIPKYHELFAIPDTPIKTWQEYLLFLLKRPGFLFIIDGKMYRVHDDADVLDLLQSQKEVTLKELGADTRAIQKTLSVQDVLAMQNFCWTDTRLKFSFDETLDTHTFVTLLTSGLADEFQTHMTTHLTNSYVEVRPIAMQQPNDVFTMPAFVAGLMEELPAVEKVTEKYSWQFWQDMRVASYTHGLHASVDDVAVVSILQELLPLAMQGLKKRGLKEEQLLKSLPERLSSFRCPADVASEVLTKQGKDAFLDALTISPDTL